MWGVGGGSVSVRYWRGHWGIGRDSVCVRCWKEWYIVGCWREQCMCRVSEGTVYVWVVEGTMYVLGDGGSRGQLRCPLKSSYCSSSE